jgi:hypothetical protein
MRQASNNFANIPLSYVIGKVDMMRKETCIASLFLNRK